MKSYPKDTRYAPLLKRETQTLWLKPSTEPSIEPFTLENTIGKVQSAPSYRHDLDLAVIALDGSIAAFATAWYHPENDIGAFEPVGTNPKHRRKSLAKSVVSEGMRRLKKLGATRINVGTGRTPIAHSFYISLGFTDY
jgi:GNAT superfamily N-acetyltransferase